MHNTFTHTVTHTSTYSHRLMHSHSLTHTITCGHTPMHTHVHTGAHTLSLSHICTLLILEIQCKAHHVLICGAQSEEGLFQLFEIFRKCFTFIFQAERRDQSGSGDPGLGTFHPRYAFQLSGETHFSHFSFSLPCEFTIAIVSKRKVVTRFLELKNKLKKKKSLTYIFATILKEERVGIISCC